MDQAILKKVDSALVTATKRLNYASDYNHDPKDKIHPYRILQMEMSELENLRNIARNKMNMIAMDGKFGAYADPGSAFYRDLINYVENVIDTKKSSMKDVASSPKKNKGVKPAKFREVPSPKNNKMKEMNPKRVPKKIRSGRET